MEQEIGEGLWREGIHLRAISEEKEKYFMTYWIWKMREIKDDSEASTRGSMWIVVPLTKTWCPARGVYFGKRTRISSIWGKLSLTSHQDIQMEMSRGWAQMQSEQFTLPFFPLLQNGWDIACHVSPRTVQRINEALFTFIPHQGSMRAWQSIKLESHYVNLETKQLWYESNWEKRMKTCKTTL